MSDARLILDVLPKPVALVDSGLRLLDANRQFLLRFGGELPGGPQPGSTGLWPAIEAAS